MTSVIIDREIGDWRRFNNRRQIASYTGLCPGEYSSGQKRLQGCVTKHGNPRLRAALAQSPLAGYTELKHLIAERRAFAKGLAHAGPEAPNSSLPSPKTTPEEA